MLLWPWLPAQATGVGRNMTSRQLQCLRFIESYLAENGVAPTHREIAAYMNIKSKGRVNVIIAALIQRGALRKIKGAHRALEVVRKFSVCPQCGHGVENG